jgi:IS5 family transposase
MLTQGTFVDAAIVAALSSTKNDSSRRDPDTHKTRKAKQWYFGMKAHVGSEAETGVAHTVEGAATTVAAFAVASERLHGEEETVFVDLGHLDVARHKPNTGKNVVQHMTMCRGRRRALGSSEHDRILDQIERLKAKVRSKGDHASRVAKRQLRYVRCATVAWRGHRAVARTVHTAEPVGRGTGVDKYGSRQQRQALFNG